MAVWYQRHDDKLILTLYIQPGARCNQVMGLHGDALKIRLSSPPIEGRANTALLHYLSTLFHVPLRQLKLIRGEKSRHKIIEVTGSTLDPQLIFPG